MKWTWKGEKLGLLFLREQWQNMPATVITEYNTDAQYCISNLLYGYIFTHVWHCLNLKAQLTCCII